MNKKIILGIVALLVVVLSLGFILKGSELISSRDMDNDSDSLEMNETGNNSQSSVLNVDTSKKFSLSEISKHNTRSDCWSSINGKVYDLTSWIDEHPGGSDRILGICGMDGSSQFNSQHSGQGKPESYLSSFLIGSLQ
jgi:cytochrome b involved in lipid metabolism